MGDEKRCETKREDIILLDFECDSDMDAIEKIGNLLIEKGIIHASYKKALLKREAQYPTGLAFEHINIAIPHSFEGEILKSALMVAIPKTPVPFLNMDGSGQSIGVNVILCFFKMSDINESATLMNFMNFFICKANAQKIVRCKKEAEVIHLFEEFGIL